MILNMKVPNINMEYQSRKDSIVYYSKYHLLTIFQIFIIYAVFKLISSTSKIYKGITLFAIGISISLFENINEQFKPFRILNYFYYKKT